jgi:phage terminase Nu1 subunit (DNA packaging protein)
MNDKIKDTEVTAAVLSEWLGVSVPAVSAYARKGVVARSTVRGRYKLQKSVKGYVTHMRSTAADRTDDLTTVERTRLLRIQADSAAAKATRLAGQYLDAGDVKKTWAEIKRSGREILMTIPARAKARVPHLTEHDLAVIREEVELALRPFDEHLEGTPKNA